VVPQLAHWLLCPVCHYSYHPSPPHTIGLVNKLWPVWPAPIISPTFSHGLLVVLMMEAVSTSERSVNFYETAVCSSIP
jgi:hypothetical protein